MGTNPSKEIKYTLELMRKGYRCSEAIVGAFADRFNIDPDVASRISSGFGGYYGPGWMCGAVTGAVMIIGLKYGAGVSRDPYATDLCAQMTEEFTHRFRKRRKTIGCEQLHLTVRNNARILEAVKTKKGKQRFCMSIVEDAVEILQELMEEELS